MTVRDHHMLCARTFGAVHCPACDAKMEALRSTGDLIALPVVRRAPIGGKLFDPRDPGAERTVQQGESLLRKRQVGEPLECKRDAGGPLVRLRPRFDVGDDDFDEFPSELMQINGEYRTSIIIKPENKDPGQEQKKRDKKRRKTLKEN